MWYANNMHDFLYTSPFFTYVEIFVTRSQAFIKLNSAAMKPKVVYVEILKGRL